MSVFSVLEQSEHFLDRTRTAMPGQPVTGAAVWTKVKVASINQGSRQLDAREIQALESWLDHADKPDGAAERVPLDLAPLFAAIEDALFEGRGFIRLQGIPVARWTLVRAKLCTGMVGAVLGTLGRQNPQGDIVGEVRNRPGIAGRDHARHYVTDAEFRPHCDAADVLGLLTIRAAARGGQSRLTSSGAVFNALLRSRPDLAQRLFEPVLLDLRDEQPTGADPVAWVTPCAIRDGRLSTFYISDYFRDAARHAGVVIDQAARELYDAYEALATDPALELRFDLAPGDFLIVNNHLLLHARDRFVDAPGAERLLLRFLVSVPHR